MSNKKFINLKKKLTLSTTLMMGVMPIAEVSAASNKGVEFSNELQTLEDKKINIENSNNQPNVSSILMEKDLTEKNEQLTKSIFRKASSKNKTKSINQSKDIDKKLNQKEEVQENKTNESIKDDEKSKKEVRVLPIEIDEKIPEDKLKNILNEDDSEDIEEEVLNENEELYEIEFYNFTNSNSDLILNQDNEDQKIVLPDALLTTILGETILEDESDDEMFKVKVDKNRYIKSLLANKTKNLDTILTILTKEDTDAIEVMKEINNKDIVDELTIEDLINIFNKEDVDINKDITPLLIPFDDTNIEENKEEDVDKNLSEEDIEVINKKLDSLIKSLDKETLYDEFNKYLDTIEYNEEKDFKGFIVGYVNKENISKENNFEETNKKLYAYSDSPVFLQNGNLEEIDTILREESVDVIGENDQWYKVSLRDLYENYDELEVEDEYAIVSKEDFKDKPIFHQEEGVLFAKQKVQLYNTPDESDESKYHVNKDGSIVQVEKALEWIKIKLNDGTELYAKAEDFDEVDSRGINKYRRSYTVAKKVVRNNTGGKSEGVVIQAPRNTENPVGEDIVEFATQFVGNKYVWGGNSLTNGVDCSGFTKEVYKRYGVNLPRWSGHQANVGKEVSLSEARPGDIVTYDGHVAIYMGNGKIVHAANRRKGIITSNVNYGKPIKSIRRVIE